MKTHKHAELIKAWADGAEIEVKDEYQECWTKTHTPNWDLHYQYRIKPDPKLDLVRYVRAEWDPGLCRTSLSDNLKLTFDGETKQLKKAEVI